MKYIEIAINHYGKGDEIPRTQSVVVLPASILRDLFAGMVAAGIAAHPNTQGIASAAAPHIADAAYTVADALMAEREKRGG